MKKLIDPNPTAEELGFVGCPECNFMFLEESLFDHMKEDHPDSVNEYTWSEEN